MFEIVQRIEWIYGHRLRAHAGPCSRLHGHNGVIEMVLASERLDEMGFVRDFGEIERLVRADLEENLDHRMLLEERDPAIPHLEAAGEVFVALPFHPTAENLARMLFERYSSRGVPLVEVRLIEKPGSLARYRP